MREKKTVAEYAPQLVFEWAKQNKISPMDVTIGSHKRIWWKGECGHEWEAIVKNRVNGSGCPYCSGNAVLTGFNDAATAAPWIVSEWSEKNGDLKPSDVTAQANKKVWWKGECGHEWQARVADRINKHTGCPYCTNERVEKGVNDITALLPELAAEMAEEGICSSGSQAHTINSHAMVRWKCRDCGCEWDAQIFTRVRGGAGCPMCRRKKQDSLAEEKYLLNRQRAGFVRWLPWIAIRYYLEKTVEQAFYNYEGRFGIPLDFYLSDQNGVIMIADPLPSKIEQRALAAVCEKSGTTLVYIVPSGRRIYNNCHCITLTDNTPEIWSEAIQAAMDLIGIAADVDIRRDRDQIYDLYVRRLCIPPNE